MKSRTELFLYQLLWTAEVGLRPSYRNLAGSFEAWAYRKGFHRQVRELERRKMVESVEQPHSTERAFRLTQSGCERAKGARNPEALWKRPWDGKWRMVVFDLPESQRTLRQHLRRTLRAARLGCLQQSVWVSPDPFDAATFPIRASKVDAGALVFFEGSQCGGETDADLVSKAWSFASINRHYAQYTGHLKGFAAIKKESSREKLLNWITKERALWMTCLSQDPLLPNVLWPRGYGGQKAWNFRREILPAFAECAVELTD